MLIDRLFVEVGANIAPLTAGLARANAQVTAFTTRATTATAAGAGLVASFGALVPLMAAIGAVQLFRGSAEEADAYEGSVRRLGATARITGQDLGFMQGVAATAEQSFGLSSAMATDLTIELTKLASKAGDVGNASAGLRAFLDLGAARGLSAQQTLEAVRQSILGIDEGTDKLFNANPVVLYQRYADAIGVSVGKLTDQQKAQAILNAALEDGAKVQGEYASYLDSTAGSSEKARIASERFGIMFGQSLAGFREWFNGIRTWFVNGLTMFVGGLQIMAVEISGFFLKIPDEVQRAVGHALFAIAGMVRRMAPLLEGIGWEDVDEMAGRLEARAVSMIASARREIGHTNTAVEELRRQIAGIADIASGSGAGATSIVPTPEPDAIASLEQYADLLSEIAALTPALNTDFTPGAGIDKDTLIELAEKGQSATAVVESLAGVSFDFTSQFSDGLADVLLRVESLTDAMQNFLLLVARAAISQVIGSAVGAVLNPIGGMFGGGGKLAASSVLPAASYAPNLSAIPDGQFLVTDGRAMKDFLARNMNGLKQDGYQW